MIRSARPTDQAFIASTWTRSICSMNHVPGKTSARFGHGHAQQRHVGSTLWERTSKQVDAVMDRQDSRCLVVCRAHDQDAITAWLVYAEGFGAPVVHYIYVRNSERKSSLRDRASDLPEEMLHRIGVGRSTAVVCTSMGPCSELMRRRYPASTYWPLAQFLTPGSKP